MAVKDSRIGKIANVFGVFGKAFKDWLMSDDLSGDSIEAAVRNYNRNADGNEIPEIKEADIQAMQLATQLTDVRAEFTTNRDGAVGPVFSAEATETKGKKSKAKDVDVKELNDRLKDSTIEYVEGNPVKLEAVEPEKLQGGKGGKIRERQR